jgi:hypothetical protein
LLAIPVSKQCALFADTIDVGGLVTHHAVVIGTDVELANVVTPNNQNIWWISSERLTR